MPSFAATYGAAPSAPTQPKPTCVEVGTMLPWLKRLVGRSPLAELRAIGCESGPRVIIEHYPTTPDGLRRMAEDARKLSRKAEGVYFAINPIPDDLLKTAADADVTRRQWLLVDVDPTRDDRVSSTDEEKQSAWIVACSIRDDLKARGLEPDVAVDSGNGYHLYYPIDLPAEDGGIVERILRGLAARYDIDAAHVDTSVYNASRVSKIPGTLARKGESTADRPHRCSYVMECYPPGVPIPAAVLADLADELLPRPAAVEVPKPPTEAPTRANRGEAEPGGWTVEQRAIAYMAKADPAIQGQDGSGQMLKTCCNVGPGFAFAPDVAARLIAEHYNPRCDPPWSEKEIAHKIEDAYKREKRRGWHLTPAEAASKVPAPSTPASPAKPKAAKPKTPTIANPSTGLIEAVDDERRLARLYVDKNHAHPDRPAILHWRGAYHAWRDGAWRILDESTLRAGITGATKSEFESVALATGEPIGKVPRSLVGDIENMLKSMTIVSEHDIKDQPEWLGVPGPAPMECLNCRNGILHIPSYVERGRTALVQPTPNFFTPYVLDYPFVPDAPRPDAWLDFLESIWPGDDESKRALQQLFGYILTPDTSQHAVFLIVGPPRCGKGTILRVLSKLIGEHNCVAPTITNLGTQYGAWSLVGKSLAYFGETRLGGRADQQAILDRILSISGGDEQSIPRKFLPDWTGRLTTRFVMLANDLPSLGDRSGALLSRIKVLRIRESFQGREDRDLGPRLERECPSILHWAIQGWDDLRRTGHLIQPAAGQEARDDLAETMNPIIPFSRDHVIVGDGLEVTRESLFERWQAWCRINGRDKTGNLQTFTSSFRSHLEAAKAPYSEPRTKDDDGRRARVFRGVGLRPLGPNGSPF